jgi:hypothetical protein
MRARKLKFAISLLFLLIFGGLAPAAEKGKETAPAKKRDPFVDLVEASGRIKTEDELFESPQTLLPAAIILKGIIWDQKRPLAVINGKIFGQGATIAKGVVLEKIDRGGIILRTQDNETLKIELRKKEKK